MLALVGVCGGIYRALGGGSGEGAGLSAGWVTDCKQIAPQNMTHCHCYI